MKRSARRGSVLLEAAASLLLMTLSLGGALELIRRAHYEVVFHHAAFVGARERALGASATEAREKAGDFLKASLRGGLGRKLATSLRWEESQGTRGGEVSLNHRYPAFFRFPLGRQSKHHLEITRSCLFRW